VDRFEELAAELPNLPQVDDRRALEAWLGRQGLTLAELNRSGRSGIYMEARRHAAKFLRRRGWSYSMIAELLERDHSSIMNLIRPRRRRAA